MWYCGRWRIIFVGCLLICSKAVSDQSTDEIKPERTKPVNVSQKDTNFSDTDTDKPKVYFPKQTKTAGPTKVKTGKKPKHLLKQVKPSQPSDGKLVQTAKRYLGWRYRYGSSSPSRGFDCSGFVYFLLRANGLKVPRTASQLYRIGTPVPLSQILPGDLVFFRNTARRRGITHVGIYIGDGKFIHSSSGRRHVTVTNLRDRYYFARLAGIRRLQLRKPEGKG